MIRFTIPGMTEFADLCLLFIKLKNAKPEMFFEDTCIESVYGGFPGSMICGGRNSLGEKMPADQVASIIGRYNEAGVACNVTFSSQHATVEDLEFSLYDRMILDCLAGGENNGVILYSDDLANWIRANYPQLKLIASTTKEVPSVQISEGYLQYYDRVVLNYNTTHDRSQLADITQGKQLEIMANEYCTLNCPYRKAHYAEVSEAQYEGRCSEFTCKHEPAPQAYGFLQGLIEGTVFLKNKDLRVYEHVYGVENYKIVGRGLERYDVIDALLYYLVQPDCWYEIRDFLIRHDYL